MTNVEAALNVLVNASRVSPILRAAVQAIEDELRRLRLELGEAGEAPPDCDYCGGPCTDEWDS